MHLEPRVVNCKGGEAGYLCGAGILSVPRSDQPFADGNVHWFFIGDSSASSRATHQFTRLVVLTVRPRFAVGQRSERRVGKTTPTE